MAKGEFSASLVLYGKVSDLGWRRGGLVFAKNGVPKPGVMLVSGRPVTVVDPNYQIRTYVDRQASYVTVGKDYREASALLERMVNTRKREALDLALGIVRPKTNEELAAEKAEAEVQRDASRKTFLQIAEAYTEKRMGLGEDSVALYRDSIRPFAIFCKKQYLEDVTGQDVVDWYDSLRQAGYAKRTCQTRYATVRGFLRACGVNLHTLIDLSQHRTMAKKPDPCTEPYTENQIQRLFLACDSYYRMAFTLLLMTGMRYREANHLTWNQIRWDTNEIEVKGEMTIYHPTLKGRVINFKTKTGKGRIIPLFPSLKVALLEWRNQHPDAVFVLGTHTRDLPNNHWLECLKKFARKAGLNCGICEGCARAGECGAIFLHKFRHTFAHRCLDRFTIHQVSKWMGHHNISVTSVYLSGTPKDADCDPFAAIK